MTFCIHHIGKTLSSADEAIFLAGPTSHSKSGPTQWRRDALKLLQEFGWDSSVYVPEYEDRACPERSLTVQEWVDQVEWETQALRTAKVLLFWVPRSPELPGLTTNIEFGYWMKARPEKMVFGAPEHAPDTSYMCYWATKLSIPQAATLTGTVHKAILLAHQIDASHVPNSFQEPAQGSGVQP